MKRLLLQIEWLPDRRGLRLSGEVDISNADQLDACMARACREGGTVSVDCAGLTFIGSSGIRSLIWAARSLEGRGRLVLLEPSEFIRRTIELMGLERIRNLEVSDRRIA